jgi:sulfur carrier protein
VKITVNKREYDFAENELNIAELLARMNFTFPMIVVKLNGVLVKKENYAETLIGEADVVEAIHLISGG